MSNSRFITSQFVAISRWYDVRAALLAGLLGILGITPAQAADAAPNCTPQALIDVARIKQQVILVGENHGTQEIPAFVSGLVCSLLHSGRSVILALERDGSEQGAFNAYMGSDGGERAKRSLTSSAQWQSTFQDGRSSVAMLRLIEDMRDLRQQGQRVALVALNQQDGLNIPTQPDELAPLTAQDNDLMRAISDRTMADNLLATAILYRRYVVVALTGYHHTSTVQTMNGLQPFRPMGQLVSEAMPTFIIGLKTADAGSAWVCGSNGCGERTLQPGPLYVAGARIDAEVELPKLTTSPPAMVKP